MENIKVFYNGNFFDCYTVVMPTGEMYGMSKYPFGPDSYNNYVGEFSSVLNLGDQVNFDSLSPMLKEAIQKRYENN